MLGWHADDHVPQYLLNVAIPIGTTIGPDISLNAGHGLTVQTVASGGAAGTVYIDATNFQGVTTQWVNIASSPVSANGTTLNGFSLLDQITAMHKARVRFVATAAGTLNVAVNTRLAVH